jgi:hypothetical protein
MKPRSVLLAVLAFVVVGAPGLPEKGVRPLLADAQVAVTAKKPITHDLYDSWKSIQGTKLSGDGVWLAYALTPQDGDGELVLRNLSTSAEIHAARGREPLITQDSRFVVYAVAPLKKDVDAARKAKKKPEDMPKAGVGVVNLSTGQAATVAEHVKSFRVPDDVTPQVVVYLTAAEPPAPVAGGAAGARTRDKKIYGSDLVIRDLSSGSQTTIPEVSDYAVNKNGAWLAYGVSSKTPANDGAYARGIANGVRKTLLAGPGNYKGFVFDAAGAQAAFISDRGDRPMYRLYQWKTTADAATELPLPANAEMGVSDNGRLEFSGDRLYFGTAPARAVEPDEPPDLIKVDIWNYKDAELQPMQKVRADQELKRTYRAVFNLADKRFAQLATKDMPDIRVGSSPTHVLGVSNVPYQQLVSWDGNYDDYYLVKLADGSRQQVLEKEHFGATVSPGGNFLVYFDEDDDSWYTVRLSDGRKTNITKGLGVRFQSETDDRPEHPAPYGLAGWTSGDNTILIYDRYDIWEVRPDGRFAPADGRARAQAADRVPLPAQRDAGADDPGARRGSRAQASARRAGDRDGPPAAPVRRGRADEGERPVSRVVHRRRAARDERRAHEGGHAGQGVRRSDQGAQRRCLRLHAVAVRGVR